MKPPKLNPRRAKVWLYGLLFSASVSLIGSPRAAQRRPAVVRVAYSAVSAGIGTLWLTRPKALGRPWEYDAAISSPPYPGIKGLEAVRESLLDSTPQLKQMDLRKFIDDRFVKSR